MHKDNLNLPVLIYHESDPNISEFATIYDSSNHFAITLLEEFKAGLFNDFDFNTKELNLKIENKIGKTFNPNSLWWKL